MPLNDFRSVHLPYCIQRLNDGRYVVLNREYKPLGFNKRDHVDYQDFPIAAKMRITKATAKKLSIDRSDDVTTIFLYNDGSVPTRSKAHMAAYLEKLALLAKIKVNDD